MLNPIRRFRIGKTSILWKYPAPFNSQCEVLCEPDSSVVVSNGTEYSLIDKPGLTPLNHIRVDDETKIFFIWRNKYPLVFTVRSEGEGFILDRIVIRVIDPIGFLEDLCASKSVVSSATTEIYIMQSLNEVVGKYGNNLEQINTSLATKAGFVVESWRVVHE